MLTREQIQAHVATLSEPLNRFATDAAQNERLATVATTELLGHIAECLLIMASPPGHAFLPTTLSDEDRAALHAVLLGGAR